MNRGTSISARPQFPTRSNLCLPVYIPAWRAYRGSALCVTGAGKTTSLTALREAAEQEGYKVEGFAPTSRATQKLGEAGIESSTLQRHLAQSDQEHDEQKRFYVLDESSLASTKQMNESLAIRARIRPPVSAVAAIPGGVARETCSKSVPLSSRP